MGQAMTRQFTLALVAVLLLLTPAFAQDDAIFTVPKVPVFAEAESAAAAQGQAQAQGRRVAMDILLRRLTAEGDWQYLPRLAAGQAAPAGSPVDTDAPYREGGMPTLSIKRPVAVSDDDLAQVEQSFAVFDEKTSRTTYRASITYRFKPDAVRRLLTEARLPYSEAQSREALVLPVLETENGLYLWESKSPWARAWLARPLVNELTPLRLPRGDQADVDIVTAGQAMRMEAEPLAALAQRYRTGQVIIAHGKLAEENGEHRLYVRLIDGYLDGRGSNRRRIEGAGDSAGLYDDAGGFGATSRAVVSAGEPGVVLAEAFFRGPADDFPALAQRAVESTVAKYARDWKERTLVDHSDVRRFELTAWFDGLEGWAEIRTALGNTPLVQEMRTGVFNNENAVIDLTVIGDEEQFALAMRQDGLTVWPSDTGWNIAEAALAQTLQARPGIAGDVPSDREAIRYRRSAEERSVAEVRYGTDPYAGSEAGKLGHEDPYADDPYADGPQDIGANPFAEPSGDDDEVPELPDDLFGPATGEPEDGDERSIDDVLIEQF
jgi:hypothetical protein